MRVIPFSRLSPAFRFYAQLSAFAILSFCPVAKAQLKSTFILNAWKTYTSVSWRDSVYLLPSFEVAQFEFAQGRPQPRTQRANYNVYTEKIEVIAENQDTVELENYHAFRFITLGETLLYNDKQKGYLEIVLQDTVSLAAKRYLHTYMQYATGQLLSYPDNRNTTSRYDRIYQKRSIYYLIDSRGKKHTPTPHSVIKLFPGKKKVIRAYLKQHPVNFRLQEDLIRLLRFSHHPGASNDSW